MKLTNVLLQDFMKVIDKCEGPVWLLTTEGNKLNLKSKLCQLIGFLDLIEDGKIEAADIQCEKIEDNSKIFRFLLYNEIPV